MSPKLSELKSAQQIHEEELRDPEIRAEYERTALAHAVAMRIIRYRAEHGLTQSALARQLGMQQPAIARLEAGDHEPSLATLARLSQGLGITFHVDITPDAVDLRATA
ncbi:MAG: helix-turn-helix transcriptional regulator [Thermoanaerobaculia bacterium]